MAVGAGATAAFAAACAYHPNIYALGKDTVSSDIGLTGYISAHTITAPRTNYEFSDEALHVVVGNAGLEVGWYVGYGDQTHTYATTPHVYATLNGPSEVDGPAISASSDYFYQTYFFGDNNDYLVETTAGGSEIFSGQIAGNTAGPGQLFASGEVSTQGLQMGPSTMKNLQQINSSYAPSNWSGMTTCADSGYSAVKNSNTSVTTS